MTPEAVRTLAQQDPVPVLSARWGEIAAETRRKVHQLEDSLRELETVTQQLAEHDLVVATDLGPTGNSARAAFAAAGLDKDAGGFALPKAVA